MRLWWDQFILPQHANVKAVVDPTVTGLSFCNISDLSIIWTDDGFSANTEEGNQVFEFVSLYSDIIFKTFQQNCGVQWKNYEN